MNIFESYKRQKEELRALCQQAVDYGWVKPEFRKELEAKLEAEKLTIGVIGQMKAGKSTFLNAFVFEKDVLPAATTPMTAALSVITYGEQERVVAEFYTEDEWQEQKTTAQCNLQEMTDELQRSKVQAAQELVAKSAALGGQLPQLLGKMQEDSLSNLVEYVGADGKYVSITKSVTIYYPKEYLKGVEIVDTPGFNDPIVSREERTKEFLAKADVVLMMLYAGRPFDATDRDIIFKNVGQCGVGKLVIGINKYDIPLEQGEKEEEIRDYVSQEIKKACQASHDDSLKQLLLEATPIPISAEMALLSYLPLELIQKTERYKHAWDRHSENFELVTQAEFLKKSLFSDLTRRVQEVISKEKAEILIAKPRNAIKAAMEKAKQDLDSAILTSEDMIKNLGLPDEELQERQDDIRRARKRVEKRLRALENELFEDKFEELRKGHIQEFDRAIDNVAREASSIIDNASRWDTRFVAKVEGLIQGFRSRTVSRLTDGVIDGRNRLLRRGITGMLSDIEEYVGRYIDDYDPEQLRAVFRRAIAENEVAFEKKDEDIQEKSSLLGTLLSLLASPILGVGFILAGNVDEKRALRQLVADFRGMDVRSYVMQLLPVEDLFGCFLGVVEQYVFAPLEQNLDKILGQERDREEMLASEKSKLKELRARKQELEGQIASVHL